MGVVYSARLDAQEREGGPARLETIADAVGKWAEIANPWTSEDAIGRRGARVQTEILDAEEDGPSAWRLTLSHPDATDASVTWTVSVDALKDDKTELFIRLDRTRQGLSLLPSRDHPAPPGCVKAVLSSERLKIVDAGHQMSTDVWVPGDSDAEDLATFIMSQERCLPIFAFTPRDDDVVDGSVILNRIVGLGHVVLVQSSLTWRLDDLVPAGFNVYGGAARLWWPRITSHSTRWDHPLWSSEVSASRIGDRIEDAVTEAALSTVSVDGRFASLERRQRERENQRLQSEMGRLQAEFDKALSYAGGAGAGTEAAALSKAVKELIDAESDARRRAEEERAVFESLATQYEGEAAELRRRAGSAELQCEYWKREFEDLNEASSALSEPNDVTSALIAEIEAEVEQRSNVDGANRRSFRLGSRFMVTLDSLGPRSRPKIVKACADIVVNAPSLLSHRDDHPLRTGDAGNDPYRVRSRDHAYARRCSIEQNVPSARRLHYWTLGNGSVEFASVNVHDDMNIPE